MAAQTDRNHLSLDLWCKRVTSKECDAHSLTLTTLSSWQGLAVLQATHRCTGLREYNHSLLAVFSFAQALPFVCFIVYSVFEWVHVLAWYKRVLCIAKRSACYQVCESAWLKQFTRVMGRDIQHGSSTFLEHTSIIDRDVCVARWVQN
jgi:hypothetical protein